MKEKKVIALLTAAGIGSRMNQDIPKQFLHINNKPLIVYTMEAFEKHPNIDAIVVVCLDGWHEILKAYAKQFNITKLKFVVGGGATGQESIKNGLDVIAQNYSDDSIVLVHDGNRGLVSQEIISDSISTYYKYGSAVAAIPCTEAVFESEDGIISDVEIPRSKLYRTQTPHTYKLSKLLWAHEEAAKRGIINTAASCSLMRALGEKVYFSKGSEKNFKITTVEDIDIFNAFLSITREDWIK